MYQINIFKETNIKKQEEAHWEYFAQCDNKYDLDVIVQRLTYIRPNKFIQVLENEIELAVLNGTEYQYYIFKKRYIDNEKLEFDYIKEYQKTIKK